MQGSLKLHTKMRTHTHPSEMLATHLDIIQISLGRKVCRLEEKHTHTDTRFWYIPSSHHWVVVQSCQTLCDPTDCSAPGFPVLHYLPEFAQTHVHWLSDAIQQSHPVIPSSSCLQSFSASRSFPISRLFTSGSQSIGAPASASVLPMNIQGWLPLGWTGLISLQSKGFLRVFSNTAVRKHQFFSAQPSLWPNSHIHTWLLEKP